MQNLSAPTSYQKFTQYRRQSDLKRLAVLVEWIQEFACKQKRQVNWLRVLEIGCGSGNISIPVASLGYRVLGLDINKESVEFARLQSPFPNCNFLVADFERDVLPESGNYDIIVMSEVLEHLVDPDRALARVFELLAPDGELYLTVPNGFGPYEIFSGIEKQVKDLIRPILTKTGLLQRMRSGHLPAAEQRHTQCTFNLNTPHIQHFSQQSLARALCNAGFQIRSWQHSNFVAIRGLSNSWRLSSLDSSIADRLPHGLVSGWYLRCCKV